MEQKVRVLSKRVLDVLKDIQEFRSSSGTPLPSLFETRHTTPPSTLSSLMLNDELFEHPKKKSFQEIQEICRDILDDLRLFFDSYLYTKEGNIFFTWVTKGERYETIENFLVRSK